MSRSECSEHGERRQGCPKHILSLHKTCVQKEDLHLYEKGIIALNKIVRFRARGIQKSCLCFST